MGDEHRRWDEMSRLDALWAVLSDPRKRHGRWELDEFLATGRDEIAAVLDRAQTWDLPQRHDRALDFGCGVGRLTRALASHFNAVVGVDISEEMVMRAKELHAATPACAFHLLDHTSLASFSTGSFDLVYSRIVLQHVISRGEAKRYISDFVRLLADGGLLVFQIPSWLSVRRRIQARPRMYGLLRQIGISDELLYLRLGLHPIRMRDIPEADVLALLNASGATVLDVQRTGDTKGGMIDGTYWATRSS